MELLKGDKVELTTVGQSHFGDLKNGKVVDREYDEEDCEYCYYVDWDGNNETQFHYNDEVALKVN